MSSRVLFIGKKFISNPSGGREMLSSLTYLSLKQILNDHCFHYEIDANKTNLSIVDALRSIFQGQIDGITLSITKSIIKKIKEKRISVIFLDGSNLGYLAKEIKKNIPNIKIICFFHNVESKFFLDSFLRVKSIRSLGVLWVNFLAERNAVKASDHIITLTNHDSKTLQRIYRKSSNAVIPIALEDKFKLTDHIEETNNPDRYILFVGGVFYANEYGIRWFIKNVSENIEFKTYVIGNGFDNFRSEFEGFRNVKVIGRVDELNSWYQGADFVIAPIFNGSGMKTKVAEALMYGKKIVATKAALIGYDSIPAESYFLCNTKEEFIRVFRSLYDKKSNKFEEALRKTYKKEFSPEAFKFKLAKILKE
jgi:glycosyltransferase involved in cell wall biosynthesis